MPILKLLVSTTRNKLKVGRKLHEKYGDIFLQLWHIGRAGSKFLNPNQEQIVSASDIPITGKTMQGGEHEVPCSLEINEIKAITEEYAQAAKNPIEAGFDGVEIHSANGYLLDQFINTSSNKCTDVYDRSIENRARFALEVVDSVVKAASAERTAIRFSPAGAFQDMKDDTVEETSSYLTSELQNKHSGLAYLHLIESTASFFIATEVNTVDTLEPYRKIWKGPIITAGGFSTSIEFAEDIAEKTVI